MNTPVQNILAVAGRVRIRSGYLHMFDLLTGLAERGRRVSLACAAVPAEIGAHRAAFPIITWGALAHGWSGRIGAETLRDLCRRMDAQVVHVHGTDLQPIGHRFLRIVGLPVVFTSYATIGCAREVARIQRGAERVIALSEYMREGLVNRCRVPREKLRVVAPGIDVRRYDLLLPRIGARTPVVGAAAPFEPDRGQSVFLRAVKILLDAQCRAEFIIAGDGPHELALRREAAALGVDKRVTFVTRLRNYRSVIAAFDIFVRPGMTGGLGYTVLEAMAMGKVVIATPTGDIPELVEEGRTGLMVPKGDAETMAREIGRLLDDADTARAMGLAAREGVAARFNMDPLVENTTRVYAETLNHVEATA